MRVPPYHWWRTVFFLIPAITVYTLVLGAASIASSLFDRHGHFAHRCARAWSWLILRTTGVRVTVEGLERLTPGTTYVFVSNHQSISRLTPYFAASLVASYITLEAPFSGMSMNPARTLGSAIPAHAFHALWIYFTAPPIAMLMAAETYLSTRSARAVYCAKFHHDNDQRCIFRCRYMELKKV